MVIPEPTNSHNEKSKQFLHGLCSPHTHKKALLQAVQIQLLLLRNVRRDFHGPASSAWEISERGKIAVFAMSSLSVRHSNCSVVVCKNQHQYLYTVTTAEQQKRQWLHFIFNDNVLAAGHVSLYVCTNHFSLDCFRNEGQYKAGFALTLTLIKGSVPTIPDPATAPEPSVPTF